ncbi:MAG TPA: DUF6089 family protein, partial [Bacteroidia bacterium]|nr:DUF6089 family protein [Bacteroidia bacterium]
MRKQVLLLLFVLVPLLAICQKNKRFRWEIGFGLGASNFLGDLGGANRIGTHFVRDLEISLTRPAVAMHMRYRANRFIGFRANLAYGIVNGNDALTEEKYRKNRNLNFKSNIIELSTVVEFYISKERPGHLYNYKRVKGWRSVDIQTYGFVGIGGFYFNPKGFGFGQWYELRPLGTEGQLVGDPKTYSNYSLCAPIGLGFKYGLNRQWSIGFDFGLRLTMTDYIDDVSTNYYD